MEFLKIYTLYLDVDKEAVSKRCLVIDLALMRNVLPSVDASYITKRVPAQPNLKGGSTIRRQKNVKYSIMEAVKAMLTG